MPDHSYSSHCIFCHRELHHSEKEHLYAVRVEVERLAAIEKRKEEKKEARKKDKQTVMGSIRDRDRDRYSVRPSGSEED